MIRIENIVVNVSLIWKKCRKENLTVILSFEESESNRLRKIRKLAGKYKHSFVLTFCIEQSIYVLLFACQAKKRASPFEINNFISVVGLLWTQQFFHPQ